MSGNDTPHILHLHSTFATEGKENRCVQLINAFGTKAQHTIVSAEPDRLEAAQRIAKGVRVTLQPEFPSLKGKPLPGRLQKLAKAMKPFDLVLTYNWGAMDAAMAHTLFKDALGLPPLIHHEDGFDESELKKLKTSRTWYRRIALGKAAGLVVPSERLEEVALVDWQQPLGRVKRIPNGIDTKAFGMRSKPDALRLIKRPGEFWVGTLAGLHTIKNLPRLVRAFAPLPEEWQLVILGQGEARDAILAEADRLGINHRVHLPGAVADPSRVIGLFDIFALSSDSEQFPLSVIEAMAAGLPIAAPAVGDIAQTVSDPNASLITPPGDEAALSDTLRQLADSRPLRDTLGEANRTKARAEFDEARMISAYRRLYSSAMRRDL
ncbi:glycosyltransferase family 4 protein [Erythrobacter mangrovi]|uniref:Glycosyltransferase family 4 protein n=1 Tax=Erythrobacter mangrovi TaxID=2739433 RepID=A0A7D4CKH3_9SPHN|nr:glycosyltransferase family 4 protein [Erythrobacter mangrovi]QKG69908.1 glycosyltransferase family 4 protein [Erythrobacter mangrovi]